MNKKILALLPALVLMLGACGNSQKPSGSGSQSGSDTAQAETVESVQISQESATLDVGETVQLTAVAKPATLSEKGVNWSSSAEAVASVSAGGLVTAKAEGTAVITAASKLDASKKATCTITVNKEMVVVFADEPDVQKTYKLGLYQENLKKYVYLKGEDESAGHLPSVDSFASAPDVVVEAGTTAGKYFIKIGSKYINTPTDYHIRIEDTKKTEWSWNSEYKTFTILPPGATEEYFIGTYNQYDTLSSCKLSAIAGDFIGRLLYQVEPCDPASVTIDQGESASVYAGGTLQLSATLGPKGARGEIAWSVSGNEKVTVSKEGLVTAAEDAEPGSSATVTATSNGHSDSITVTIKEQINYGTELAPLTIEQAKAVLDITGANLSEEHIWVKGYVYSNTNTGVKSAGTTRGTIWLTNDDGTVAEDFEIFAAYVEDDNDHKLTEQAAGAMVGKEIVAHGFGKIYNGTYELTSVTLDGGKYDNPIVVAIDDSNPRTVTAVELSEAEAFELVQGQERAVSATLKPYASVGTVTFTVSPADQGVTYEDGKIKVAADATVGDYTLTATCGTLTDSVNFTVKEATGDTPVTKEIVIAHDSFTFDNDKDTGTYTSEGFTFSYDGNGGNTKQSSYTSADSFRVYKGAIFKITANATLVKKIVSITFTTGFTDKYFDTTQTFTGGAFDGYTAKGATAKVKCTEGALELSFTAAAQVRVGKVVIEYVAK